MPFFGAFRDFLSCFLCDRVGIKTTASEKVREKEKERDTDRLRHAVISPWRRPRRAPAVYWFSELLCSHCYPRVLSAVHWTHAAPPAVIPVWEAPALTTGPSHSTRPRRSIHADISIASAVEVAGNHLGELGASWAHSHIFEVYSVRRGRRGIDSFFSPDGRISPVFHCVMSKQEGGALCFGGVERFRATRQAHLFPDLFSQQLFRRLNEFG